MFKLINAIGKLYNSFMRLCPVFKAAILTALLMLVSYIVAFYCEESVRNQFYEAVENFISNL